MDLGERVDRLTSAFERADREEITALCSPDVRVKRNNGDERGLDLLVATVAGLAEQGIAVRYGDVRRVIGQGAVAEQHRVTLTRADGAAVSGDVCLVVRFDEDGSVRRLDEYVDPTAFAPLLDPSFDAS